MSCSKQCKKRIVCWLHIHEKHVVAKTLQNVRLFKNKLAVHLQLSINNGWRRMKQRMGTTTRISCLSVMQTRTCSLADWKNRCQNITSCYRLSIQENVSSESQPIFVCNWVLINDLLWTQTLKIRIVFLYKKLCLWLSITENNF